MNQNPATMWMMAAALSLPLGLSDNADARSHGRKARQPVRHSELGPIAGVIAAANDRSRQTPATENFVNASMFYDFVPGSIYEVHTSPRFITTIALRPGEQLLSKAAGDTVRWVIGETHQGSGSTSQTLVLLKPIQGDLRTNIVLTTNERTYMIEAVSHVGDTYTSIVSWNYPRDQLVELADDAPAVDPNVSVSHNGATSQDVTIDSINFDYAVRNVGRGSAPAWMPVRVFDDGSKTYIQFPPDFATTEAPPLFAIGEHDTAELVNYRVQGRYYVVDRLLTVAELRLGEKDQQIVRIKRNSRKRA